MLGLDELHANNMGLRVFLRASVLYRGRLGYNKPMAKAVKAVVFDLYGVLGLNGWQSFKDKHFANNPAAWIPLSTLGKQVDAGQASQNDFVSAISKATGESAATVTYQFERTTANKTLLDFIKTDLAITYKLAILSNASRNVLPDIFTAQQLDMFSVVLSSYTTGLAKPDPPCF